MNNQFSNEPIQPSDNNGSPVARMIEDEFKSAGKLEKTKKKLKKCKKLYRLAKSSKKSSRKKYKKKLRKYEMRINELEHELEVLRIRAECEIRLYQLLYQLPQMQQIPQPQVFLGSRSCPQLPDFTMEKNK